MEFYREKFKVIRKSKKIKVTELSEKLGINRNTLWLWESGKTKPSEKMIRLASKYLNISVNEISDLSPEIKVSKLTNNSSVESTLSDAILLDINNNKKTQSFFLEKLFEQFNELNSTVSLISTFINSIPIICYAKDINNKYLIANNVFLKNASLNTDYKVIGKTDYDFYPNNEAKKCSLEDEKIILTGKAIVEKESFIPGTRHKKWGLISKFPLYDNVGNIAGLVGYFIDITERRKAENKVKTFINALKTIDEFVWIAKKAENRKSGGIQFDEFVYKINSQLIKKIFSDEEIKLPTKKMYELVQSNILSYCKEKEYTVEAIKENGFIEMRLNVKGADKKIYNIKNKIYYDRMNDFYVIITSEDSERKAVNRIIRNLEKAGIDKNIIQEATDIL